MTPDPANTMYGRHSLTIHGGANAGSKGCIDLVDQASTFFDYFTQRGQNLILEVEYGNYDGVRHPLIDQELKEFQVLDTTYIQTIAQQNGLTLQSMLNIAGNEDLRDRMLTLQNGASVFLYKENDVIKVTPYDNDFDYVAVKNGVTAYNPDTNTITTTPNNTLLDFSTDFSQGSSGTNGTSNLPDWQSGVAIGYGNYSLVA